MHRLSRPAALLSALLSASFLTGCETPLVATKPEVIRLKPPASLLQCAPEPPVPDVLTDQGVALWIVDLREAGASCRAAVEAVREWAKE